MNPQLQQIRFLVASFAMVWASQLGAQSAEPAEIDRAAREAYSQGRYEEAAQAFERANAIASHGSTLFNAAMSWEKAGEPARAADDYEAALALGNLDSGRSKSAQTKLSALNRSLGIVEVSGNSTATLSLAHVSGLPLPARVHLRPGSYELTLQYKNGRVERRPIVVRASEVLSVVASDPAPAAASAVIPISSVSPKNSDSRLVAGSPPEPPGAPVLPWVFAGAGVAFGGLAVFLGLRTLQARDDFEASGWHSQDDHDRTIRYRTWTNVAWGASALCVGTAVVFWLGGTSRHANQPTASRTIRIAAQPSGITALFSF